MRQSSDSLYYFNPSWITRQIETLTADVVVYGGTPAGIFAAVKARRLGKSVLLLHPGKHLGGMTTGGLGYTDYGSKKVIGGMARQFYRDVGREYGCEEQWCFEPHVATAIVNRMVKEADVLVRLCQYLDCVSMDAKRIVGMTMLGGLKAQGLMFIDATYEGDLMTKAGVSHIVGRESNSTYGETLNGIQVGNFHQFSHCVDPYVKADDPNSGLLPHISQEDLSMRQGEADHRVQAYCFRVCMTDDPALLIPWEKPADFDPDQYVLATRWLQGDKDAYNEQVPHTSGRIAATPAKFDIISKRTPGGFHKTDTNNHGAVSSDFIGGNYNWAQGDYAVREQIFQRHVSYQKGLYWHIAQSPDIPERYRMAYRRWGLPKDEFQDTGHWPHQLYIREARRMIGDYVLTECDCRGSRRCDDTIAMGSYNMDSHNCSRFVKLKNGQACVLNEGDVQVAPAGPYGISYRCIVPGHGQCENLLVPVCLSASHIAYGSVRMEPVFMALGEVAAIAASHALEQRCTIQSIDFSHLRAHVLDDGAILNTSE